MQVMLFTPYGIRTFPDTTAQTVVSYERGLGYTLGYSVSVTYVSLPTEESGLG